jgi:hypothetical protein
MPPFGNSLISGSNTQINPDLDGPPPRPPTGAGPMAPGVRPGQLGPSGPPGFPGGQGTSPLVANPEVMAIQGLAMMEKGSRLLASVLPGLTPLIADTIERLRETVPKALSELSATGSSMPAGAGVGPGQGAQFASPPPMMSPSPAAGVPGRMPTAA